MEIRGHVIRKRIGAGSKSERDAVCIRTKDGDYVLRRKGGLAFDDPGLEALVGHHVAARGTLAGYTFLMETWTKVRG